MATPNWLANLVRGSANEINLVPVPRVHDYHPVVNDVAAPVLPFALNRAATHAFWTLEGADVRVTFDGSDPVAGVNGHLFVDGAQGCWAAERMAAARAVRNAGANAHFHITQLYRR